MRVRNNDELLYAMIDRIRLRPGLYLGNKSITRLKAFLNRYSCALSEHGIGTYKPAKPLDLPFAWFVWFIQCRYCGYGSGYDWSTILLENCHGDEAQAMELFFQEYDLYRSLKPTACRRAELTEDNERHLKRWGSRDGHTKELIYEGVVCVCDLSMNDGLVHIALLERKGGRMEIMEGVRFDHLFFRDESHLSKAVQTEFGPVREWRAVPLHQFMKILDEMQ